MREFWILKEQLKLDEKLVEKREIYGSITSQDFSLNFFAEILFSI